MNLDLDEKYRIVSDEYNFILQKRTDPKRGPNTRKGKKLRKTGGWKDVGYWQDLGQLLLSYSGQKLRAYLTLRNPHQSAYLDRLDTSVSNHLVDSPSTDGESLCQFVWAKKPFFRSQFLNCFFHVLSPNLKVAEDKLRTEMLV